MATLSLTRPALPVGHLKIKCRAVSDSSLQRTEPWTHEAPFPTLDSLRGAAPAQGHAPWSGTF